MESDAMLALLPLLAAGSLANADLLPLLRKGDFQGPINGRETIRYVGHIRQNQNDYQIYVFEGLIKASEVDHGVNWLMVMKNNSFYLGGYHIPMPTTCKVQVRKIICKGEDGGSIDFTKAGPPHKVLFAGEELPFVPGKR
jgi:hypothetical protein